MSNKTLEAIFSVKNNKEKTHKVITVLGTRIKIKRDDIEKFKEAYENYKIMHDPSLYIGIPDDITLQLMFNNDCNCRCKFCSANNQTRQTRQMISQDMLYKYLEPLYEKTKTIIPTYGEITHCKEGYEYLKWINEHYPHINFFIETNGIAFNKRWFELAAKSLMVVKFSVNAIDEETFKKTVWEKDRVFTTIKNNIENYIIYLQERGLSSFKPSISSVLNSTNYHIARDFVKMGINWNLQSFGFYFDHRENPLKNTYIKDKSGFDEALMTVLELEKLLKGKVYFYFRIFMPANLSEYEKKVEKISIESLQEKIRLIELYINASSHVKVDPDSSLSVCAQLLKTPGIENSMRPDDIYIYSLSIIVKYLRNNYFFRFYTIRNNNRNFIAYFRSFNSNYI